MSFKQQLEEKYPLLSDAQKKVAKVFFEKPEVIAFTPAFEIGKDVGVSESTVIRLSQAIGYKGYAELQKMIQQELQNGRTLSQYQTIIKAGNERPFYNKLFKEDIRNIEKTMEKLDENDFEKAIQMITDAENIFVLGSFSSFAIASYLSHWLNMFFHNTSLLMEGDPQYYTHLSKVNTNTLIISIIFPRYAKTTLQLTKRTKEQGARILSVTDSKLSPIREYSNIMLISPINTEMRIDSYTAALSLISCLIRSVAIKNNQEVESSLREIEKVLSENEIFYNR